MVARTITKYLREFLTWPFCASLLDRKPKLHAYQMVLFWKTPWEIIASWPYLYLEESMQTPRLVLDKLLQKCSLIWIGAGAQLVGEFPSVPIHELYYLAAQFWPHLENIYQHVPGLHDSGWLQELFGWSFFKSCLSSLIGFWMYWSCRNPWSF